MDAADLLHKAQQEQMHILFETNSTSRSRPFEQVCILLNFQAEDLAHQQIAHFGQVFT